MSPALRAALYAFAAAALSFPAVAQGAGDVAKGQTLFKQRCTTCHTVQPGAPSSLLGPNLSGVVGRKSGTRPDFKYSPALAKAAITWNHASLMQYMAAPSKMAPGTRMVIATPKPQDQADIAAYLATLK